MIEDYESELGEDSAVHEMDELVHRYDSAAKQALESRRDWEERQVRFYKMRHEGLGRVAPPWPGAANLHFPLGDMLLSKLKPHYTQQIFANELIANFYSLKTELNAFNVLAAQWFDYRIKQGTNFEEEIISVVDYMLQTGHGICKVRWDSRKKTVVFDSVDPLMVIVPQWTNKLRDADFLVEVKKVSKAQYKLNPNYNQDDEFVRHLCTSQVGESKDPGERQEQEKNIREGIVRSSRADQIVLWEVWYRDEEGTVKTFTYAPAHPSEFVRDPMESPYDHGQFPYVDFPAEIKDRGYYAPRGVLQQVAAYEQWLCKLWNEKSDAITLFNRPTYRITGATGNPLVNFANFRMAPGQALPPGLEPVQQAQPPISFDVEMNQTRMMAEQLIGIPDGGLTSHLNGSEARSATEVQTVAGLMSQVVELRARVFRQALAECFQHAWSLLVQYANDQLEFFYRNEMGTLPDLALVDEYRIAPNASGDNMNKSFVFQKKLSIFQTLANNPFVNMGEMTKDLIAADDPQNVKRFFQDPQIRQSTESEEQAQELNVMVTMKFPAPVDPTDDDLAHMTTIGQWFERQIQTGTEVDPESWMLVLNHAVAHLEQMKARRPDQYKQSKQEAEGLLMALQQQAQQA
ncbi:MAG: portal protein, partial [Pontimonas sp.]